jgi:hypothetical protein
MAKKNAPEIAETAAVPEVQPSAGGSYVRHPESGELEQVEGTVERAAEQKGVSDATL